MILGGYVKKEDVKGFLIKSRKFLSFLFILLSIIFGLMTYFTFPGVMETYEIANTAPGVSLTIAPYTIGFSVVMTIVIGIYALTSKINFGEVDKKLQGYKEGEMIQGKEFAEVNSSFFYVYMFFFTVIVVSFFFGVVGSLDSLISQIR